jgi:hypothetical protein
MQFTKLFSSILDSTIWQEPNDTKVLWITLLAMSDRNGEVHASIPGIARRAGISLDSCERALGSLMAADPYSRNKDHHGRRIAEIDGGWGLLNHAKYRELLSVEERREYNRRKQAESRAKRASASNGVKQCQQKSAMSAHTEAEAEAEADKGISPPSTPSLGVSGEDQSQEKPKSEPKSKKPAAEKSANQIRVESWFGRRPETGCDRSETIAWRNAKGVVASTSDDEWMALERFYKAPKSETYARKSIATLLNNWQGEIDRARAWRSKRSGTSDEIARKLGYEEGM